MMKTMKKLVWIGDALKQLKQFPEEIKDSIGYALHQVQEGKVPRNAKPLKGLRPAVMEIVSDYDTNTYRTVYTVKIAEVVYVLHCFQKKSKRGIKTPKQEVELIKQRLREAEILSQNKR
ncbi:MAG: hypothetical protein COW05_00465 [Gammaproteobacteria bacterium CG12_big_fil_rev_8_21_14_0_65_46_12]|nr:MAG: hypothetical protein COW05_00465 [Gammaproteobacteria bacterium CG12_big_fil_rev_8_21_14_0_65_46_12]